MAKNTGSPTVEAKGLMQHAGIMAVARGVEATGYLRLKSN
jgi:hypothetical protein